MSRAVLWLMLVMAGFGNYVLGMVIYTVAINGGPGRVLYRSALGCPGLPTAVCAVLAAAFAWTDAAYFTTWERRVAQASFGLTLGAAATLIAVT